MTQQLNSVGQPETPLYIPFMEFADKEQCMTFARNNQLRLFNKSIQAYDKKVLPTKINCINEEIMKQTIQTLEDRVDLLIQKIDQSLEQMDPKQNK